VDLAHASARIEAPVGLIRETLHLGAGFGVQLVIDHATTSTVRLDFDALGLGRLANRTFRVRRGRHEARLTLSSYGRPRRW
jgi:hypothetical protein